MARPHHPQCVCGPCLGGQLDEALDRAMRLELAVSVLQQQVASLQMAAPRGIPREPEPTPEIFPPSLNTDVMEIPK